MTSLAKMVAYLSYPAVRLCQAAILDKSSHTFFSSHKLHHFSYTLPFKYGIIQKGLTQKKILPHFGGSLVFFYCIGHLRGALL